MVETIFGAVLIIGCVAFIMFLWRMSGMQAKSKSKKPKIKPKKIRKIAEKKVSDDLEVPPEWREEKGNPSSFTPSLEVHRKIRVPGLRTFKRVLAAILLIINFFISQATLMSATATQPLFLLFGLNCLFLLDYLWKTRRSEIVG